MKNKMKAANWVNIPGYEGLYQITILGKVRSLPRNTTKGKVLKHTINTCGYPCVNLSKNGKSNKRTVHQLVLLTFVGQRPKNKISRHLDGNSTNSNLTNLSYGTYSDNNYDAVRHGTFRDAKGSKHHFAKLTEKKVIEMRKQYITGLFSQKQLAKKFNVCQQSISDIITKKTWRHI